jgi:hypothetical protein
LPRYASALLLGCVLTLSHQAFAARAQAHAQAQAPESTTAPVKKVRDDSTIYQRNDELTLASLRPGRDVLSKAQRMFTKRPTIGDGGASRTWNDACRHELLSIIADDTGTILEIRVAEADGDPKHECAYPGPSRWVTGRGLVIGDSSDRLIALYGQPGSRGPSTKGGQKLELFYYAFDWAGPDVPQVMTVLCTPEKDGKAGRVVEITLAAPSL